MHNQKQTDTAHTLRTHQHTKLDGATQQLNSTGKHVESKGGKKTVGRTLKLKALAEERLEKETHSANNYLNAYPRACKGV